MEKLGERELDIMQALWKLGRATVGEVQAALREQGNEIAYTTVQTMLNRLEVKQIAARDDSERTHYYYAILKEPAAAESAIRRLTGRFFRGSAEALVSRLVEKDLTPEQLDRIQILIDEHRNEDKK
jgi:BlaI family transcriptional regulator, penicillinase repressor